MDRLVPEFAQKFDRYSKYSYTEKKPSYYKSRLVTLEPRLEPQTEYKPSKYSRLLSEYSPRYSYTSRYVSPTREVYKSPVREVYKSPVKETYISPYKSMSTYATSPYKTFYPTYTAKASEYVPSKKLEYTSALSPRKQKYVAEELAGALEEQIAFERRYEHAKEELVLQTDFNLMDGFRLFDYLGKGFVTLTEFYDGLKELGVAASYDDISLLFKRYDKDSDGRVRYSDFCSLVTPKRPEYEKILTTRPPYYLHHLMPKDVYFSAQTRLLFRDVVEIAMDHEKALENIRQRLKRSALFNTYDAFNALDVQGKGKVTLSGVTFAINTC